MQTARRRRRRSNRSNSSRTVRPNRRRRTDPVGRPILLATVRLSRRCPTGPVRPSGSRIPRAGGGIFDLNCGESALFVPAGLSRVRPEGFEPPTLGSEDRCAIQLRHGRVQRSKIRFSGRVHNYCSEPRRTSIAATRCDVSRNLTEVCTACYKRRRGFFRPPAPTQARQPPAFAWR